MIEAQSHAFEQKRAIMHQPAPLGDDAVAYGSHAHHSTLVQIIAARTRFAWFALITRGAYRAFMVTVELLAATSTVLCSCKAGTKLVGLM